MNTLFMNSKNFKTSDLRTKNENYWWSKIKGRKLLIII